MQLIFNAFTKRSLLLFVFFIVGISGVNAQVTEVALSANGSGITREEAIQAALVSAASQAFGIKLSAQTSTESAAVESTTSKGNDSAYLTVLNKQITQQVSSPTNSPILGFTIDQVNQTGGSWQATVTMRYAKFEAIGSNAPKRRSMIVVTKETKFRDLLLSNAEEALVGSRQFDVLNRDNQQLFEQEKAFIKGSDAAAAEVARLGQASGADYLVLVELENLAFANNQRETIRMTGEVLVNSSVSGSVSVEVIEFSTRKLKWSGSEKFTSNYKGATSVSTAALSKLVSNASIALVDQLVQSIYPIRVVKVMGKNTAVINRGQSAVKKGQVFNVFMLGEELKDPQSGESLGALEMEIGIAKVMSTNPKYSVLKIDDGEFDQSLEYIVRPAKP